MQHLKIMSRKDMKPIVKWLNDNFGMENELDYAFFRNPKDKIYILSKKFAELDDKMIRINNLGLYFGKIERDGFRLTMEGAQIIGAKHNIIDIGKEDLKHWMQGEDINATHDNNTYVILRHKKDIIGCGKYKEGKILNSVPKERRIVKHA